MRDGRSLENIKIIGDKEAVAMFPAEMKKLIEEKGYHPKQVFSCDETFLFWKKRCTINVHRTVYSEKCTAGTRVQSLEGQISYVSQRCIHSLTSMSRAQLCLLTALLKVMSKIFCC